MEQHEKDFQIKKVIYRGREWPYLVTTTGELFRIPCRYTGWKMRKVEVCQVPTGYLFTCMQDKGKKMSMNLHRIVAETFLPNPNKYEQVNHKNGIKVDNRVENLEWCSQEQNMRHAVLTGLMKSSLDIFKVREIKALFKTMKRKDIAKKYDVSISCIDRIKYGSSWKDVVC